MKWNGKKILIVEDDEVSSILLEELLEETKMDLLFAKTGKIAISEFNKTPGISLVLMDLQLPEMDGFDTLEVIRSIDPNIPIIAQTAFYTSDMQLKCEQAGFNDFISKPLSIEELIDKITPFLNS